MVHLHFKEYTFFFLLLFLYHQAQFNHVGTTAEYFEHLFNNATLTKSLSFRTENMVSEAGIMSGDQCLAPASKKKAKRSFEHCFLMHTILRDRARCDLV